MLVIEESYITVSSNEEYDEPILGSSMVQDDWFPPKL